MVPYEKKVQNPDLACSVARTFVPIANDGPEKEWYGDLKCPNI